MRQQLAAGAMLLAAATLTTAQQYGPPSGSGSGNPYSSDNNPFSSGSDSNSGSGSGSDSSSSPFGSNGGFGSSIRDEIFTRYNGMILAHAVMAALAFGFIFPSGGILIRLASFPKLWLVHGIIQLVAYLLYIAAFGIGVYMASNARMLSLAHPILGIVVFVLIIFQPFLGFIHHVMFKKYSRRTVWSYAHLWLGRIAITLGIINGGLGLQLAQRTRVFAPSQGAVIGYSVAAGVMWLIYVASAIWGEVKRSRQAAVHAEVGPPPKYEMYDRGVVKDSDSEGSRPVQYA